MKFIKSIEDIFKVEELRNKILTTLFFVVLYRLGSFIQLPGVNPDVLSSAGNGLTDVFDMFVGGAFSKGAIFGLGIMPYISASIVLQLAQFAIPSIQKLSKEGESGRKKINQYTRILTVIVCVLQSFGFVAFLTSQNATFGIDPTIFTVQSIVLLTAGTMFCMWMGDQITEKGIGNGISILITIGIIARFPIALTSEFDSINGSAMTFLIYFILFFVIVLVTIAIVQAVRNIPVNYANQLLNKGGRENPVMSRSFIPLKVNQAGVMPIIFAQAVVMLPPMIAAQFTDTSDFASFVARNFAFGQLGYVILTIVLIIVFTFFYTAMIINPVEIADDLKRNGGFIPGVKPGEPTSTFIDSVLSKITLPGSLFIAGIAILPSLIKFVFTNINQEFVSFFGGTSLLIIVGVVIDTAMNIRSHLLMKEYDGMMSKGSSRKRPVEVA
jgi:preprotein translocase subunit SecY